MSAREALFEAVHARYQKRCGAPILAHTNDEIFALCEQVVIVAPPERDDDQVFNSVLTAIWMSPRETDARRRFFSGSWPADKVTGADRRLIDAEAELLEQFQPHNKRKRD